VNGETCTLALRSTAMKLAVIATIIFVVGLSPGLFRSEGPVQDAPRMHAAVTAAKPAHPVLVKVAGLLRLRL
jgi:hypothetical protein